MTRPIQDTLDSTIRDAVGFLPKSDKMDVLLCTMERLPMNDKSRMVIEIGVESFFQVTPMVQESDKSVRAHLLRAKSRITAGSSHAALQDLRAILQLDPGHCEARDLLSHFDREAQTEAGNVSKTYNVPHLPAELWREVVSYLSRRDLRNLVSVPHVLSSIARQFLFRDVTLQLGTGKWDETHEKDVLNPNELDKWHAQRSAEIICRLNSNATYARQVRSLTILVSQHSDSEDAPFSFFMAMLTGVITKLVNLTTFKCRADNNALTQVLEILEKSHPDLQELAIFLDSPTLPSLPKFGHLTCFVFENDDDSCTFPNIQPFLIAHGVALRTLVINSDLERPLETPLSINNLRNLSLSLTISRAHCFRLLLENGQQLESLQLEISSEGCVLSNVLRSFSKTCSFPLLRRFSFILQDADEDDLDLFPAVAEIVRGHPMLEALSMMCNDSGSFGYDAPIWGVIPSLIHLRALSMDVPENLPSGLCGWLVPRTVVALALELGSSTTINCDELIPGLPTGLKVLALPELEDLGNNLSLLPALRLVYFSAQSRFRTVCPADGEFTDLGVRQGDYYMDDLLVQLDCEEAEFIFTP